MRKQVRLLAAAILAGALTVPSLAHAAEGGAASPSAQADSLKASVKTEAGFAAAQIGKQVYVYDKNGQLFRTQGKDRVGDLQDLFVIPYGPQAIPMILIKNDKNGYMVFSDLWPKIVPGKEKDTTDAYYSGRVHPTARDKVVTRTGHHYAEKDGEEIVVYTANDFDDLKKGFHESFRVKGELRGLILYDCCPYLVVDDGKDTLSVYHAGENGAELASSIEFK